MNALNSLLKRNLLSEIKLFNGLIDLMKPRVMSLVIFTCAVGLLTAPNQIPIFDAIISMGFVTLGAGAAGALNMWYEADLDKLMSRTCLRPIPTGKVNKSQALIFGLALSLISIYGLYYFSNLLSAFILFFTIFFYVVVYTVWLKRRTPQNIVIGGAAGALPPVIGWTIVTGNLSLEAISFFLIIFFWTPSHFWALSLYKAEDYRLAKIPMLPVISGVQNTKINILIYSLTMLPVLFLPYHIGFVGNFFAIFCLPLTIYYNYICFDLYKDEKHKFNILKAKKVFSYSIIYLFAIFVLFLVDNFV